MARGSSPLGSVVVAIGGRGPDIISVTPIKLVVSCLTLPFYFTGHVNLKLRSTNMAERFLSWRQILTR